MASPGRPGLPGPLGLTARPAVPLSSPCAVRASPAETIYLRLHARKRAPGLFSGTPAVSTHPPASRGAREAMHRGRDALNESQAAELAETRPLTPPSSKVFF
ncbi:hypothetical protein NDU88_003922 [Pleurodeles waltl]|uniref:Uncharacterized protein n=1 Tax=Pleurodeles waltl TaxID=8319 RepID=A0AAV7RHZ9_PLEWA|nr:hypothetical protein NDU88_003922 [Pleurodeles waltl]